MEENTEQIDLDRAFADYFGDPDRRHVRRRPVLVAKRFLDLFVASVGILVTLPVIATAAVATLLDTGRPVFYTQVRRGLQGRRIRVWKMRTMKQDTDVTVTDSLSVEEHGRFLTIPLDSEVYTKVGRVLEVLWIVELPQLWSVLVGEMSIVGNRPLPDYVIEVLGTSPDVLDRFGSPPGITGYPQISGRELVSDDDRIRLEKEYTGIYRKGNIFFEDLRIIALTLFRYVVRPLRKN